MHQKTYLNLFMILDKSISIEFPKSKYPELYAQNV